MAADHDASIQGLAGKEGESQSQAGAAQGRQCGEATWLGNQV